DPITRVPRNQALPRIRARGTAPPVVRGSGFAERRRTWIPYSGSTARDRSGNELSGGNGRRNATATPAPCPAGGGQAASPYGERGHPDLAASGPASLVPGGSASSRSSTGSGCG